MFNLEKLQQQRAELLAQFEAKQDRLIAIEEQIEKLQSEQAELRKELGAFYKEQIKPVETQITEIKKQQAEEEQAQYLNDAQALIPNFIATIEHQAIKEFAEMVIEKDVEWFMAQGKMYRELGFKEYYKQTEAPKTVQHFISSYCRSNEFKAEVIKLVVRETQSRINKLLASVEKKVGNIVDCHLAFNYNNGLDGRVTGTNAEAHITTVLAGGYNIQRLHYRTLVKVVK